MMVTAPEHVVRTVLSSVSNCNGDRCISDDNWICVAFPMVARKILHASGMLKPIESYGLNNTENKTALNKQQT